MLRVNKGPRTGFTLSRSYCTLKSCTILQNGVLPIYSIYNVHCAMCASCVLKIRNLLPPARPYWMSNWASALSLLLYETSRHRFGSRHAYASRHFSSGLTLAWMNFVGTGGTQSCNPATGWQELWDGPFQHGGLSYSGRIMAPPPLLADGRRRRKWWKPAVTKNVTSSSLSQEAWSRIWA